MEHVPTNEADDLKVFRIARELGIGLEDAAVTCAGFELAFSDDGLRREIFGIIDLLDDEAAKKGEPLGLILSYAVELGQDGIRVGRYADEIPAGEIVNLTPTDRAMIFLKIKDNFPTQQFLGSLIVNKLPSLDKEGCPVGRGGLTESEIYDTEIPNAFSTSESTEAFICDIPTRLTLEEGFPFLSALASRSQRGLFLRSADRTALKPPHHLPPWAALQAGMPAFQSTSGLSPPLNAENVGHSKSERCPERPPAIRRVETRVSHLDL